VTHPLLREILSAKTFHGEQVRDIPPQNCRPPCLTTPVFNKRLHKDHPLVGSPNYTGGKPPPRRGEITPRGKIRRPQRESPLPQRQRGFSLNAPERFTQITGKNGALSEKKGSHREGSPNKGLLPQCPKMSKWGIPSRNVETPKGGRNHICAFPGGKKVLSETKGGTYSEANMTHNGKAKKFGPSVSLGNQGKNGNQSQKPKNHLGPKEAL